MVLAIVLSASPVLAAVREMVLRPIPLAVGLACLFGLVRTDTGPLVALATALAAHAVASVAQEAALRAPLPAIKWGASALCCGASIWVMVELAHTVAHVW